MSNYTAKGLREAVETLLPHIKTMHDNGVNTNISSDLNDVGLSFFKKHFHCQDSVLPEHKKLYEMCWQALKDLSEHGQFMYSNAPDCIECDKAVISDESVN